MYRVAEIPSVCPPRLSIPSDRKRRMVLRSLEITVESLRAHIGQAMTNEQILDQLFNSIQPDGTLHL
jgi:hypothetical protein